MKSSQTVTLAINASVSNLPSQRAGQCVTEGHGRNNYQTKGFFEEDQAEISESTPLPPT